MPLRPPVMNMLTNAAQFSITVLNRTCPPQSVPIQLKTLIPLGSAINTVLTMNVIPRAGFMPLVNMWCPQTTNPSPAIAVME